jgi:transposase InsO family protein
MLTARTRITESDRPLQDRMRQTRRAVRGVDDLELATLNWVHWFNQTRLHPSIGYQPPIEKETAYYRQINPRQQPLPGELTSH